MKTKLFAIIGVLGIFLIIATTSCKDPKPPKAIVTVKSVSGTPLVGATVRIYSDPHHTNNQGNVGYVDPVDTVLVFTSATDESGQASFEFKYEAIYDVLAWYLSDSSNDTLKGSGVLILENDNTYEETVIIR